MNRYGQAETLVTTVCASAIPMTRTGHAAIPQLGKPAGIKGELPSLLLWTGSNTDAAQMKVGFTHLKRTYFQIVGTSV